MSSTERATDRAAIRRGPPTPDRLKAAQPEDEEFIAIIKNPFFATQGMGRRAGSVGVGCFCGRRQEEKRERVAMAKLTSTSSTSREHRLSTRGLPCWWRNPHAAPTDFAVMVAAADCLTETLKLKARDSVPITVQVGRGGTHVLSESSLPECHLIRS